MRFSGAFTVLVLFASSVHIRSQIAAPSELWSKSCFSANWGNCPAKVCHTVDRGYTISGISGDSIILMHVDSVGNEKWNKRYSTYDTYPYHGSHEVYSLQLLKDNGYILAGMRSISLQTPDMDAWILRTDSSGFVVWKKTFGKPGWDWDHDTSFIAYDIKQTVNGDFIIAGGYGAWICRLDGFGQTLWSKVYDGLPFRSLIELPGGEILAAGNILLKLDSNGGLLWRKKYYDNAQSHVCAILKAPNGTIMLLGETNGAFSLSLNTFVANSVLTCIDTGGAMIWEKFYGNSKKGYDALSSMIRVSDGGYVLAGTRSSSMPDNRNHLWLVRTNSFGDTLWTYTSSLAQMQAHSIDNTFDNGFILAADGYTSSAGNRTYLLKMTEGRSTGNLWEYGQRTISPTISRISNSNPYEHNSQVFNVMGRVVRRGELSLANSQRPLMNPGIYISMGKENTKVRCLINKSK